jgi:hypothetical protein
MAFMGDPLQKSTKVVVDYVVEWEADMTPLKHRPSTSCSHAPTSANVENSFE